MFRYSLLLLALTMPALADDWPQWMGPNRDGVWAETGILDKFPDGGPKELWRVPIGGGYAGPAVAGRQGLRHRLRRQGEVTRSATTRTTITKAPGQGARPLPRREDRQGTLEARVRLPVHRSATPPGRAARRPSTTARSTPSARWATCSASTPPRATVVWSKNFPKDYEAKAPIVGLLRAPAGLQEPRSSASSAARDAAGRRVRQGHRQGSVEGADDAERGRATARRRSSTAGGTKQLVIWHAEGDRRPRPGRRQESTGTVDLEPAYGMSIMAPRQDGDYLFAGGIGGAGAVLKLGKAQAGRRESSGAGSAGEEDTASIPVNMTPFDRGRHDLRRRSTGHVAGGRSSTPASGSGATFKPVIGKETSRRTARPAARAPRSSSRTATASSCSPRRAT